MAGKLAGGVAFIATARTCYGKACPPRKPSPGASPGT